MLLLCLVLMLAGSVLGQPVTAEGSCEDLDAIPADQRCAFISQQCDSDSRIPYAKIYYCSVAPAGIFAKIVYMIALMLVLPLIFNLLADTAELYFSPTMAVMSQSIPKMRPRFAGVTFVAMGNGAPDLSANISAIRSGSVLLSAGALTGAAMFVQCVVASEVIRISDGVSCGGATLRDVGIYAISITGVLLTFYSGTVTRWFIAGAIVVYIVYVVWVFCGDEWHARGRPQPAIDLSWKMIKNALSQARGVSVDDSEPEFSEGLLPWATVDVAPKPGVSSPSARDGGQESLSGEGAQGHGEHGAHSQHGHRTGIVGAKLYQQAVWADLGNEPSLMLDRVGRGKHGPTSQTAGRAVQLHERAAASSSYVPPSLVDEEGALPSSSHMMPVPMGGEEEDGRDALIPFSQDDLDSAPAASAPWQTVPGAKGDVSRGRHGQGTRLSSASPLGSLPLWRGGAEDWKVLWDKVRSELTIGAADEWPDMNAFRRRWRSVTYPILLPIYGLLRMTVPYVDPEGYSQPWMVTSMLFSPLAVCWYFGWTSVLALGSSLFVGIVLSSFVHLLTKDEDELPALDLGTRFAFGPAVFSLIGFFMGVLWIDSLASEAVGVLTLLARLLHVPSSLMGLTLLAWGGSLGDLFGNSALARRGHASTALTACFAGPLFSVLISMAMGFSALFAREHISRASVTLTPDVAVGCFFLVAYNIILATVGWFHNWKLPRQFYLFARVWYAAYLLLASGLGLAELWS